MDHIWVVLWVVLMDNGSTVPDNEISAGSNEIDRFVCW